MRLAWRHPGPVRFDEGDYVGGHVITRLVGPRGAGELIYDAQARDGSDVSIVVSGVPRGQRDERARFRRGARIRAAADHPGLLPVRGYGEHAGAPFVVTDPYPPETLADRLDGEAVPSDEALPMLAPAAEALDLCHARGLIHQNLSDESLLLDGDRFVLDAFGLTTASRDRIWGNLGMRDVRYATPEEMRGEPLDPASNVYSLAGLLVHVLTGRPPYEGPPVTLTYAHLAEPPPRPSERAPELGRAIDVVIAWGMDKDPWRRPPSAAALLEAAADALGVAMPASRAGVVVVPRRAAARARDGDGRPGASRRRWLTPAAASAVAVICAAAPGGFVAGSIADPFGGEPVAPERRSDARLIGRLDERRGQLRAQLADARLPQQQSVAAAELASSYRDAARAARSSAIAAVAHAAGGAYSDLAGAADAGSAARFADASEAVRRAEERLAAVTARSANLQDERK